MSKLQFRDLRKAETSVRASSFVTESLNEKERTVDIAISSEEPVEQFFGREILDHGPGSIRMVRINSGIPLLVQHDAGDHIGILESAHVDSDRRLRGTIRFGRSARATEVMQDVADGIRKDVSVGYQIFERELVRDGEAGDLWLVTDWMPREVSLVSIPADATVGVGRSDEHEEKNAMEKDQKTPDVVVRTGPSHLDEAEAAKVRDEMRCNQIRGITEQWDARVPKAKEWAAEHIARGMTAEMLFEKIMDAVRNEPEEKSALDIGLTDKETKQFSLSRAALAMIDPSQRKHAEFEFECSDALAKQCGKDPAGIFIPMEVRDYQTRVAREQRLTFDTILGIQAGNLVGTEHRGNDFIEALRAESKLMRHSLVLADLVQDINLPKQTKAGTTTAWTAEGVDVGANDAEFNVVNLTPNGVGSWVTVTHKLLRQSIPSIDALMMEDITAGIANEIDIAGFGSGTGAGDIPRGIQDAGTAQTVVTTYGTDYWLAATGMESFVGQANALSDGRNPMYMSNYSVAGTLKGTPKDAGSGQFVAAGNPLVIGETIVNGYRQDVTSNVPAALWIFGTFRNWVIGLWGPLDMLVDPYSGSKSGNVTIRGMAEVDENARHDEAFVFCTDA